MHYLETQFTWTSKYSHIRIMICFLGRVETFGHIPPKTSFLFH